MTDELRYALMLTQQPYTGPRRHGKHCFCHECLQDEMNAKDDRIDQLTNQVAVGLTQLQKLHEAMGHKLICHECAREFYVYRSDIHHASEALPVTHCPYCGGGPVDAA